MRKSSLVFLTKKRAKTKLPESSCVQQTVLYGHIIQYACLINPLETVQYSNNYRTEY